MRALFAVLALVAACGDDAVRHLPDAPSGDSNVMPDASPQIGSAINGEASSDQFGVAIALSNDGSRIIIGGHVNDGNGTNSGHVRVFQRSGDAWMQLGADIDGEAAEDRFGFSVAISSDGSRIAAGAAYNDGAGGNAGHVRVYDFVGGAWAQVGVDIDPPAGASSAFGWALGMSANGTRLVVGAPAHNSQNGTVHVFDLISSVWTPVGTPLAGAHSFGTDAVISADGTRIAVAAASPSGDGFPGQVDVYELIGTTWTPVGGDLLGEAASDLFGDSLALSANGSVLAVGATENDGGGTGGGQVRVFRFAANAWTQVGADLDGPAGFDLGYSIGLSSDGSRVVAGAPGMAGSARLYTLSADTWTLQTAPDFGSGDETGTCVAISPDGHTVALSAALTDETGNNSGQVRVYNVN